MSNLSVLDLAFLALETAASPRHVAGLAVLNAGSAVARRRLSDLLVQMKKVEAAPPFNQKLDTSLMSMPRWVDDPNIDTDWHVRHVALPKPGNHDQLMRLVSRLHSTLLDRSRPLWEFYLIEGLANDQFAIYFKIHHAYMDGASMSRRITRTLNRSADDKSVTPIWGTRAPKPELRSEERSIIDDLVASVSGAGTAIKTMPQLGNIALQHGLQALGLKSSAMPIPFSAPRTRLNRPVTRTRKTAIAQLPLNLVRQAAADSGATVNDILLSLCDAALTAYLDHIGETLDEPLVAQMPISLREDDKNESGNRIAIALLHLASGVRDPIKRLAEIRSQAKSIKKEYGEMSAWTAMSYSLLLQSAAQASEIIKADRLLRPLGNVLVSNVIGPIETLYLDGCKLVGMYPLSTIPPGMSINVTFYTTGGTINVGIIAGPEAIENAQFVADEMVSAFAELERALRVMARPV